jgi:hypothetical protein
MNLTIIDSTMDHINFWIFNGFNAPEGDLDVTLVVNGNYGIIPFYRCVNTIIIDTDHLDPVFIMNYNHITRVSVCDYFIEGVDMLIKAFPKIKKIQSSDSQFLCEFIDKCKDIKKVEQVGGFLDIVKVFIESKIQFVYHAITFAELIAIDTIYASHCKNLKVIATAYYREIVDYMPKFITVEELTVRIDISGKFYAFIPTMFRDLKVLTITFLLDMNNADVVVERFEKMERIEVFSFAIDKPNCILRGVSRCVELSSVGNCNFKR